MQFLTGPITSRLLVVIALIFATQRVVAGPIIQQVNSDSWNLLYNGVAQNQPSATFYPDDAQGNFPGVQLPRFNPLLGTLLDVQIFFNIEVQYTQTVHCRNVAVYCSGSLENPPNSLGHTVLLKDLGEELGVSFLNPGNPIPEYIASGGDFSYGPRGIENPPYVPDNLMDLPQQECETFLFACELIFTNSYFDSFFFSFDSGIDGFIDDLDTPFDDNIVFMMSDGSNNIPSAWYVGFPNTGSNEAYMDDGGDAVALFLLFETLVLDQFDGHGLLYSDAHFNYFSSLGIDVIYNYEVFDSETPTSVPEPSIVWLLCLGFAGLVCAQYRREGLRKSLPEKV